MKDIQCEFSSSVGVKVAQSKGKITTIEAYLRTQTNIFFPSKYCVRTDNPRYLGKEPE